MIDDHDAGGKLRLVIAEDVISEAVYSHCRQYRYILHRRWEGAERSVMFIMLNPSTATEEVDDPTVRKCRTYATRWGYDHLIVGNLMAYRSTNPMLLRGIEDPVGPENLDHLRRAIETHHPMVVCAWGCLPRRLTHIQTPVVALLRELAVPSYALKINTTGEPGHPLYLSLDAEPMPWSQFMACHDLAGQ